MSDSSLLNKNIINYNMPDWFKELAAVEKSILLSENIKEWYDEDWRQSEEGGFKGFDFCHSAQSAVHILDYVLVQPKVNEIFPTLTGVTHFTKRSESHRGFCHGGSMCALMDDAIGWMGFCATGQVIPWSGYTVQVNTSLKKPVPVGSVLRLDAKVIRQEGERKFWISSYLTDSLTNDVHCEAEGLFLLSKNNNNNN
eukprot:gene16636-22734_t